MPTTRPISDGMTLTRQGISENMCALTFDDGPSKHTARLLDTLKQYDVQATFFVVGSQVERHPDLIRRMIDEGHEVGNHSYSHNALRRQSPEDQQADLRKLDTLLRELGVRPRFVRPPYGFYDHNTVNAVREMDGHLVMWSIDSMDWRKNMDLSQMQAMYRGAPLRGVFLFHDTHALTVDRIPQVIEALAATNCRFVTLSEYIDGPKKGDAPTMAVTAAPAGSTHPDLATIAPTTQDLTAPATTALGNTALESSTTQPLERMPYATLPTGAAPRAFEGAANAGSTAPRMPITSSEEQSAAPLPAKLESQTSGEQTPNAPLSGSPVTTPALSSDTNSTSFSDFSGISGVTSLKAHEQGARTGTSVPKKTLSSQDSVTRSAVSHPLFEPFLRPFRNLRQGALQLPPLQAPLPRVQTVRGSRVMPEFATVN